jgi:hypothetical protein
MGGETPWLETVEVTSARWYYGGAMEVMNFLFAGGESMCTAFTG